MLPQSAQTQPHFLLIPMRPYFLFLWLLVTTQSMPKILPHPTLLLFPIFYSKPLDIIFFESFNLSLPFKHMLHLSCVEFSMPISNPSKPSPTPPYNISKAQILTTSFFYPTQNPHSNSTNSNRRLLLLVPTLLMELLAIEKWPSHPFNFLIHPWLFSLPLSILHHDTPTIFIRLSHYFLFSIFGWTYLRRGKVCFT